MVMGWLCFLVAMVCFVIGTDRKQCRVLQRDVRSVNLYYGLP